MASPGAGVPAQPSKLWSCATLRDGFQHVKVEVDEEERKLREELLDFKLHLVSKHEVTNPSHLK